MVAMISCRGWKERGQRRRPQACLKLLMSSRLRVSHRILKFHAGHVGWNPISYHIYSYLMYLLRSNSSSECMCIFHSEVHSPNSCHLSAFTSPSLSLQWSTHVLLKLPVPPLGRTTPHLRLQRFCQHVTHDELSNPPCHRQVQMVIPDWPVGFRWFHMTFFKRSNHEHILAKVTNDEP